MMKKKKCEKILKDVIELLDEMYKILRELYCEHHDCYDYDISWYDDIYNIGEKIEQIKNKIK